MTSAVRQGSRERLGSVLLDFLVANVMTCCRTSASMFYLFPFFDAAGADNRCVVSGVLCRSGNLRN